MSGAAHEHRAGLSGPTDYAFPSDHTALVTALAAGIWLVDRRLGALAAALALTEGFTRVYLGMHYPHDVAAGMLLSSALILGGWALVRGRMPRLIERLEHSALRPIVCRASAE